MSLLLRLHEVYMKKKSASKGAQKEFALKLRGKKLVSKNKGLKNQMLKN